METILLFNMTKKRRDRQFLAVLLEYIDYEVNKLLDGRNCFQLYLMES